MECAAPRWPKTETPKNKKYIIVASEQASEPSVGVAAHSKVHPTNFLEEENSINECVGVKYFKQRHEISYHIIQYYKSNLETITLILFYEGIHIQTDNSIIGVIRNSVLLIPCFSSNDKCSHHNAHINIK